VGIMLATNDSRAASLLDDLSQVTQFRTFPKGEARSDTAIVVLGSAGV
jgi:hypothetical protein